MTYLSNSSSRRNQVTSPRVGGQNPLQFSVVIVWKQIYYLSSEQVAQRRNLGEGVSEMREHFDPGYAQRGDVLVFMLGGGDKSTQKAEIKHAIALAKTLQE